MDTQLLENIILRIESLPDDYLAIKKQAKKYLKNNSNLDNNGTINIFHRPWVAPVNWSLMLFKGADKIWFEQFENKTQKIIPEFYKRFLTIFNGSFIHEISFYGLTPSIYSEGQLNRSILQCHDLTSANNNWIKEYKIDKSFFYFGGRPYSYSENLGYFFDGYKIRSILKKGKVLNEWTGFFEFLRDEIETAEQMILREIPKGVKVDIEK